MALPRVILGSSKSGRSVDHEDNEKRNRWRQDIPLSEKASQGQTKRQKTDAPVRYLVPWQREVHGDRWPRDPRFRHVSQLGQSMVALSNRIRELTGDRRLLQFWSSSQPPLGQSYSQGPRTGSYRPDPATCRPSSAVRALRTRSPPTSLERPFTEPLVEAPSKTLSRAVWSQHDPIFGLPRETNVLSLHVSYKQSSRDFQSTSSRTSRRLPNMAIDSLPVVARPEEDSISSRRPMFKPLLSAFTTSGSTEIAGNMSEAPSAPKLLLAEVTSHTPENSKEAEWSQMDKQEVPTTEKRKEKENKVNQYLVKNGPSVMEDSRTQISSPVKAVEKKSPRGADAVPQTSGDISDALKPIQFLEKDRKVAQENAPTNNAPAKELTSKGTRIFKNELKGDKEEIKEFKMMPKEETTKDARTVLENPMPKEKTAAHEHEKTKERVTASENEPATKKMIALQDKASSKTIENKIAREKETTEEKKVTPKFEARQKRPSLASKEKNHSSQNEKIEKQDPDPRNKETVAAMSAPENKDNETKKNLTGNEILSKIAENKIELENDEIKEDEEKSPVYESYRVQKIVSELKALQDKTNEPNGQNISPDKDQCLAEATKITPEDEETKSNKNTLGNSTSPKVTRQKSETQKEATNADKTSSKEEARKELKTSLKGEYKKRQKTATENEVKKASKTSNSTTKPANKTTSSTASQNKKPNKPKIIPTKSPNGNNSDSKKRKQNGGVSVKRKPNLKVLPVKSKRKDNQVASGSEQNLDPSEDSKRTTKCEKVMIHNSDKNCVRSVLRRTSASKRPQKMKCVQFGEKLELVRIVTKIEYPWYKEKRKKRNQRQRQNDDEDSDDTSDEETEENTKEGEEKEDDEASRKETTTDDDSSSEEEDSNDDDDNDDDLDDDNDKSDVKKQKNIS